MVTINGTTGVSTIQDGTVTSAKIQDGTIAYADMVGTDIPIIGVGQTWQDVTASRALGVTYTNTTGKPVQVHITGFTSAGTIGFQINSVTYQSYTYISNGYICFSVIVPHGATYGLTNPVGVSINKWSELR